ncbi:response regulator [Paraburkholderia sp. Ac-20336]|uniref:hybrid sensor histidine kinase/response regulator n=1 Tax=Burkholderiaceae TaxID=119060 RepID=UPI0014200899|nr:MULTISPECIES: response regulator [Burkholderiaceae]MBN3806324.1 response regulator [Paraburkholderia sp. Ac-20336]MBN3848983.1 response regulator [Paraburkholderia sp. Ac-20342]NIF51460.1 response regulator [Burkholderia sp. Ax-1724]NIF80102.1 response regulator [Paraburkholderia sp. Cy-641]
MTDEVSTPHAAYVLVVDDDEGILRLARKSLERAGCRVAICAGIEAARDRLANGAPDLLVLDYQLSGPETGLDFFRRLRAEGVRIPAILVTGFTDESRVIEALRAGVSDVVPKSGDYLDYLPEAVERVLSQVRLQRASDEAWLLRDRELHYRTLSEALPHLVLTCNAAGDCDFLSKQWYDYTGMAEPCPAHGLAWLDAVHPDDREEIRCSWLKAVASQSGDYRHEMRIRRHDGEYRWFDVRVVAMRDAEHNVSKWFGSCTDIHSQREAIEERERLLASEQAARQAAEEANRAKDRFLAMLSHELRTPLTPVLAGASVLEMIPDLPDQARGSVRMIRRNVELEARLIDDLLDLTRVANGKLRLSLETVDVHEVIDSVLELFRSEIQVKQQDVHIDKHAAHHYVLADRARLQQMLWNLIRNAAKFTPDGGHIYVRTRDERMHVQISVEDTGIGIEPEQIGKLFNAFEQGDQNMTRQFGGLGLGLAITKALTDVHGGSVIAQSPGPHCGATFTITLPTAAAPAAARPVVVPSTVQPASPLTVLLIEDHADTAEVMAQLIHSLGHEVTVVGRVDDALAATQLQRFDLIVSDVGLPDGTGLDFVKAFREHSDAPAVALTGFGTDEDVRRCLSAGFTSHLTKPVNFGQLETMIDSAAQLKARKDG